MANKQGILSEIFARYCVFGPLAGGILGAAYVAIIALPSTLFSSSSGSVSFLQALAGTFLVICFAAIFGGLVGGIVGLILGFVNAIIIGTVTLIAYTPLPNDTPYQTTIQRISSITTFVGSLLLQPFVQVALKSLSQSSPNYSLLGLIVFTLIPAIIAAFAFYKISTGVADWYQRETKKATSSALDSSLTNE